MENEGLSVNVENNEDVVISRKKRYRSKFMPTYRRIGIDPDLGVDVLDVLGQVSKPGYRMFLAMKGLRDEASNLVTLAPTGSGTETCVQANALKELRTKFLIKKVPVEKLENKEGFMVRVPKRTYMMNPYYFFPRTNDDFENALFYWRQL